LIQSETDKAFEQSKESLTKEEKVKERMAALRAKRKPPKLKGVHPSVLALPDDNTFSHKNIKKWIETQQGIAKAAGMIERSRNRDVPQKERDKKMRERYAAQGYITSMQRYLRTGDWDNMYFGEYEEHLTKWKVVAPAGDK
jgi:hypothetical protein|tara:strand:- start:248 stop:670 length:423 start_codon:yes stop_codon:yes gene_type:complete